MIEFQPNSFIPGFSKMILQFEETKETKERVQTVIESALLSTDTVNELQNIKREYTERARWEFTLLTGEIVCTKYFDNKEKAFEWYRHQIRYPRITYIPVITGVLPVG